jgi:hypothetical protein
VSEVLVLVVTVVAVSALEDEAMYPFIASTKNCDPLQVSSRTSIGGISSSGW